MSTITTETYGDTLIYLPDFQVLVCRKCQFAIQPSAISNHLKRHQIYRENRKRLLDTISQLQLHDPQDVPLPDSGSPAIPTLPVYNGYTCLLDSCGYNCASLKRMQSHVSATHSQSAVLGVSCAQVCLQTFFQGTQIKYFRVAAPEEGTSQGSVPLPVHRSRGTTNEAPAPHSNTAYGRISSAATLTDLRLMHHYTFSTAATLSKGSEPEDFWTYTVPFYASHNEYLMHGLLSIAAAHLAYLETSNRLEWMEIGMRHHGEGLACYRVAFSDPQTLDANAALIFSKFLVFYKCADYQLSDRDELEPSNILAEYMNLVRGGCTIGLGAHLPEKGSFSRYLIPEEDAPSKRDGSANTKLPFDQDARFAELGSSLDKLLSSGSIRDPEEFEAIHQALRAVRVAFCKWSDAKHDLKGRWGAIDYWPTVVSKRYCEMVTDLNPIALVIFAHWCILLHWHSPRYWFMASHARVLLETISASLEDEQFLRLVTWPRSHVGI